jgi:hypothetical protein
MRCDLREKRRFPALTSPRGSFGQGGKEASRHSLFVMRRYLWGMPLQAPASLYSPALQGAQGCKGLQGSGESLLSLESLQSFGSFLPLQGFPIPLC